MVVLADEVLESFFEADLSGSFRLEPVPELELPVSNSGLLGDLWSTIATDSNKKMFNMFTDEIGKTIGKHQVSIDQLLNFFLFANLEIKVIHRPSIGRYTKLEEPKARESLLTPSMRKSPSKSSLTGSSSTTTLAASSSSTLAVNVKAEPTKALPTVPDSASFSPMVQAVNASLMERTPFAIDDAKDEEDESDDELDGPDNDDQVMDEVRQLIRNAMPPGTLTLSI